MTDKYKLAKEIGEKFEKEFGTKTDYFNHRMVLFLEMKLWIIEAMESYHQSKLKDELIKYEVWLGEGKEHAENWADEYLKQRNR